MSAQTASFAILLLACAAIAVAFVRGLRRPARERRTRALLLAAGLGSLVAAQSPTIDALAEASFAWHMVQHLVLIVVAAPLVVLADPLASVVAGLRPGTRAPIVAMHRGARAAGFGAVPSGIAFGSHMAAIVLWHVPPLFDAAVRNEGLHALEHVSFFGTALLFWGPVLTARGLRRIGEPFALGYLVAAGFIGSALGALLTFSSTPWYAAYVAREGTSGALHDQQLAGLVMWIPPGIVYLVVAAVVFWRWIERVQAVDTRVAVDALGTSAERVSEDWRVP